MMMICSQLDLPRLWGQCPSTVGWPSSCLWNAAMVGSEACCYLTGTLRWEDGLWNLAVGHSVDMTDPTELYSDDECFNTRFILHLFSTSLLGILSCHLILFMWRRQPMWNWSRQEQDKVPQSRCDKILSVFCFFSFHYFSVSRAVQ